jgi:hypothetical protein
MRNVPQLSLVFPSWGGRRPGAGRPPGAGRRSVPHRRRVAHDPRVPIHVTLRAVSGLTSLRSRSVAAAVLEALANTSGRAFRVVHFSVQPDHIHLIVEAGHPEALARGCQGLAVRVAKAVNRVVGRRGAVWGDRYHARPRNATRGAPGLGLRPAELGEARARCAGTGPALVRRLVQWVARSSPAAARTASSATATNVARACGMAAARADWARGRSEIWSQGIRGEGSTGTRRTIREVARRGNCHPPDRSVHLMGARRAGPALTARPGSPRPRPRGSASGGRPRAPRASSGCRTAR